MKGRGNPPPQGRGKGGGYFGNRGRGAGANNHLRGNIPTIGTYLDLQPGKDIVPGTVECLLFGLSKRYYGSISTFQSPGSTYSHLCRTTHNSISTTSPSRLQILVAALEH